MKILHTADWHIGQVFYDWDRSREHEDVLRQLHDIIAEEQPDLMLVSGDVFHNPRPSASSMRLFTEAITSYHRASPKMDIVITAGNHDSASQHEMFAAPWRELGVHVIGSPGADEEQSAEKLIIELPGKSFVLAVPFLYTRSLTSGTFQEMLDKIAERNSANLPVIAMAHVTVAFGGDVEKAEIRGDVEAVEMSVFGKGYDYLALGHIHRPHTLRSKDGRATYSGSLLPVSFEESYEHSVEIIEISKHGGDVTARRIPLQTPVPVVTLPAWGYAPWSDAENLLKEYKSDRPNYIRLNLERGDVNPMAMEICRKICGDKGHRFCVINYPAEDYTLAEAKERAISIEEFKEMTPLDVARLFAAENNKVFEGEIVKMFEEIIKDIEA